MEKNSNDIKNMCINDRYRYFGNTDQAYSVKRYLIDEGKAHGTTVYEVKTGGGLVYKVMPDNGLDIAELSYKGININYLSKNNFNSPYAADFTHSFPAGMLYTCGLLSTGGANLDGDILNPTHGRYNRLPADRVSGKILQENVIEVSGRVQETELFGHSLMVNRTISSEVGSSEVVISDELTNCTPKDEEFMVLYHMNFGYPFLSKDLQVVMPEGTCVRARSEEEAIGLGKQYEFSGPIDGCKEQVFFYKVPADKDGYSKVRLINNALQIGAEISWTNDTLCNLVQWKCMRSGEYVLGIEPSNTYIMGRKGERENGTIGTIKAFETIKMQVKLRFFDLSNLTQN